MSVPIAVKVEAIDMHFSVSQRNMTSDKNEWHAEYKTWVIARCESEDAAWEAVLEAMKGVPSA